jgi:hypothetical protein
MVQWVDAGECLFFGNVRTPAGQTYPDGRALMDLPPRTVEWVEVAVPDDSQAYVYRQLEIILSCEVWHAAFKQHP